jgi:hypothetical protein
LVGTLTETLSEALAETLRETMKTRHAVAEKRRVIKGRNETASRFYDGVGRISG